MDRRDAFRSARRAALRAVGGLDQVRQELAERSFMEV